MTAKQQWLGVVCGWRITAVCHTAEDHELWWPSSKDLLKVASGCRADAAFPYTDKPDANIAVHGACYVPGLGDNPCNNLRR